MPSEGDIAVRVNGTLWQRSFNWKETHERDYPFAGSGLHRKGTIAVPILVASLLAERIELLNPVGESEICRGGILARLRG